MKNVHLVVRAMNNNFASLGLQVCVLFFLMVWTGFVAKGQEIKTIAGTGQNGYNGDNKTATLAQIDGPAGAAFDEEGNTYLADLKGNRIRKISATGIITTVAGVGTPGYSGDGGPATSARLFGPSGLAIDKKGNLYFADSYNQRVRKVNLSDGIITTIAGTGVNGFGGNGAFAVNATLQIPSSVAIDAAGNVYIADCENNCIRKINSSGIISVFAGNGARSGTGSGNYSGDGGLAINASINHPKGLAVDVNGNVYFADCFNHRVRKINTNGIITTIAGTGDDGYNGDMINAAKARLNYPAYVAVDSKGNVFVSDHSNNRVRMINRQGIISTVAGTGQAGFSGDGGSATEAQLSAPTFIAIDKNDNLLIGDNENNRVRMVMFSSLNSGVTNSSAPVIKAAKMERAQIISN